MTDYRDDLPGGDMRDYVDPRGERERWRLIRPDVEAKWMEPVLARLRQGSALTSELAAAAGIQPGIEYSRFMVMLNRLLRVGRLRKIGKRRGAIHMNNVWQMGEGK